MAVAPNMLGRLAGTRVYQVSVRHARRHDETLLSVQAVEISFFLRRGLHGRRIGSGKGFGDHDGAYLAFGDTGKKPLFLFLRPVLDELPQAPEHVPHEYPAQSRHPAHFFHRDAGACGAQAKAAVLFRDCRSCVALLTDASEDIEGELSRPSGFHGPRPHFLDKPTHLFGKTLLCFREPRIKIHLSSSLDRCFF